MQRLLALLCLAVLQLLLAPALVFAHAVHVDGNLQGDKVEVEAYYDGDVPAIKARVQLVDAQEQIIASGTTDEKGKWSCAIPAAGVYEVRLDAGAGHRAQCSLTVPAQTASVPSVAPVGQEPTTGVPWLKVLIGLVIIGGCSGAFLLRKITQSEPAA